MADKTDRIRSLALKMEEDMRNIEREEEGSRMTGQAETDTVDMGKVQANEEQTMDWSKYKLDDIIKTYDTPSHTILDDTIGETLDKTLSFTTHFFENYMKKVYEAESLMGSDATYMKYAVGLSLFIRDDGNTVYAGIALLIVSILIYFLNITTE
jgi:hypothetical protein